ncbi:MAG: DUF488 domain-containing protein [Thermomicrobiales bacterium]
MSDNVTIHTIGHSNVAAEEVVALLAAHEIEMVVDVRSVPYSQYTPQFNREMFEIALKQAGIGYTFAGETLGGRPKDPTCYRSDAEPKSRGAFLKQVDYGAVMERPWYQRGIARLVEIAGAQRTAIMCSEENPDDCHRHHLIAQTLLPQGITVNHIRHTRAVEEARIIHRQLSLL